jgi:S1-C subfamily serine protease
MFQRTFPIIVLSLALSALCGMPTSAQTPPQNRNSQGASQLRDYVGLINQSFHPEIVTFMRKIGQEFEQRGQRDAAKSIEAYLKGGSGTGFVYVAPDGANYIITNHHVITQAYDLSISFEKTDGSKTVFSGLSIVAADEEMDIALLAFENGARPFTASLSFLDRPVEEGETVYSAGFPAWGVPPSGNSAREWFPTRGSGCRGRKTRSSGCWGRIFSIPPRWTREIPAVPCW